MQYGSCHGNTGEALNLKSMVKESRSFVWFDHLGESSPKKDYCW